MKLSDTLKRPIPYLIVLFLIASGQLFAQGTIDPIRDVWFKVKEAKIGYETEVRFKSNKSSVTAFVSVERNKIDTSFTITRDEFSQILRRVKKVNSGSIKRSMGFLGADGSSVEIGYGNYAYSIVLKAWYPEYKTGSRNLTAFLNASKEILSKVGLNYEDYFDEE